MCLSLAEIGHQQFAYRSRWTVESIAEIPQKEFLSLNEINWGDHLVHQDFGIGLYRGLEIKETAMGVNQEFIKIEYADRANVYVPVEKFNRVHKMLFMGKSAPALSTLNSPKWDRLKLTVKNSTKEVVRDLINLYRSRNRKRGFTYDKSNEFIKYLESSFPYDETPGQLIAINDVFSDMEKEYPVDRLICGDVGFGKTEVALRAALKSIISGKKVLFLTPTTILADQHYISTKNRLGPLGIKVELLSRFKTKKQQYEILAKMLSGSTDLVIGTHRLLSQDVAFPDLGLLIIDEEHRFGVRHKEKLRNLRSTVDVLTLTATPIPRTLQQALLGIRDISRINTPPKTRRPIKTFVQYFDWTNIKKIINNELSRGGQVYILHNDIASIPFVFKKLRTLFPNRVIGVVHGKLNVKGLEKTILAFFDGKIEILLCTTIIESGLDVANANTIIINNSQNFGLSQLYQIRGRVGRGYRQAYCHLLIPKGKSLGEDARHRLKAIEQFTNLGSGYDISLKDLEIRGAGNLFGYKQSGHIAKVGFEMYCKLLQESVDETYGDPTKKIPPKVSLPIDAFFDSTYIQLVQDRLYFYQQLSDSTSIKSVNGVQEELRDRFGKLPEPAKNLIYITKIRVLFTGSSITSLSVLGSTLKVKLSDFKPFKSFEQMVTIASNQFELYNLIYKFLPEDNGFTITVNTRSISQAIKIIDVFVELFSKGNFS
jgi:transcription-repair coupling factor (superfamily II helicase)